MENLKVRIRILEKKIGNMSRREIELKTENAELKRRLKDEHEKVVEYRRQLINFFI